MIFNSFSAQNFTQVLKDFSLAGFFSVGATQAQKPENIQALKDGGVKIIDVSQAAVKTVLKPFETLGYQAIIILIFGVIGLMILNRLIGRLK